MWHAHPARELMGETPVLLLNLSPIGRSGSFFFHRSFRTKAGQWPYSRSGYCPVCTFSEFLRALQILFLFFGKLCRAGRNFFSVFINPANQLVVSEIETIFDR